MYEYRNFVELMEECRITARHVGEYIISAARMVEAVIRAEG
jgi:hypothetical protein